MIKYIQKNKVPSDFQGTSASNGKFGSLVPRESLETLPFFLSSLALEEVLRSDFDWTINRL